MLIAKATGVWGDGADEATFNLEVVGNTPSEVEHFRTLVDEPTEVSTKFENGALKITLSFERKVPLTVQAAKQAEALAKAAKDAKQAAKDAEAQAQKDAFEHAAQAKAEEILIEQRAQEILKQRTAGAPSRK